MPTSTSHTPVPAPRKPWLQRAAELFMVLALAGMVVAVFVNVVLRYVFNTSIVSYEEIARLLFVWLVAVGSIVAAFEGSHLGFDLVTSRLSARWNQVFFYLSQALIVVCMVLLLQGSWTQVQAGLDSYSTVLGYPLALGAAATLALAVGMLVVSARNLRRGSVPSGSQAAMEVE